MDIYERMKAGEWIDIRTDESNQDPINSQYND